MRGDEAKGTGLPAWLDGQTIAIIGAVLTVAVGISAMILVSTVGIRAEMGTQISGLRTEVHSMHKVLTDRLEALDGRLRNVEQTVAEIRSSVDGLEKRLQHVELHVRESLETAHVVQRPTG